jgi:hypothetical protein
MWEFEIMNTVTKEKEIIFGHSLSDAFDSVPSLNPSEWECLRQDYID